MASSFQLDADEQLAVDELARFAQAEIAPSVANHLGDIIPKDVAHGILRNLAQFGVGSGWVREEGGGLGLPFRLSGRLYEALARSCPDVAGMCFAHEGAAMKIFGGARPAVREKLLGGLIAGELIGCSAVTEASGGSNVRAMRTRAEDAGSHYRVAGEKMWISNATIADVTLLTAKASDGSYVMLAVDLRETQVERREIKKLGLNGWSLGQLNFVDTLVPKENVIGEINGGLRETMRGFERARCFVSTIALGLAGAALDHSIRYAKDRQQFGKSLGELQLIQELIANMATELDASRLLVYRALDLLDQGVQCNKEAAMAKVFATEAAVRITSKAIQIHGAYGISTEFPLERLFRCARMLTIPDGTTQINQLVIGRELLGLSAF